MRDQGAGTPAASLPRLFLLLRGLHGPAPGNESQFFLNIWSTNMQLQILPIGLTMALLVLAVGHASAADLIINGDFSAPDASTLPNDGSVYKFVYAGDPSLTGWTVTNGSVETDLTIPTFGAPTASGNPQNLDLDGNSAGTISQSFATTAGQAYTLAFFYSNNPYGPGAAATVTISDSLTDTALDHPLGRGGRLSGLAVRPGDVRRDFNCGDAHVHLERPGLGYHGILLDNVSVAAVQPSSMTLLGLGSLGIAAIARRRRNRRSEVPGNGFRMHS